MYIAASLGKSIRKPNFGGDQLSPLSQPRQLCRSRRRLRLHTANPA